MTKQSPLAARLERLQALRSTPSAASIPATQPLTGDWPPGCQAFPASFAQARLYFLHQLEPQLTAYHLPLLWRLTGALDLPALQQALADLIERHPTLRTSFRMVGEEVLQLLHPPAPFPLRAESLDARRADEVIGDWLQQEAANPFDLDSGQLLRARLLQVGENEHLFLLNHHHIASDAWSRSVLGRDLVVLYNAHHTGRSPDLRPLTVHYQDYSAWQRQRLRGERLQSLTDYWIGQLRDLEPLMLPSDHPRPVMPSYRGESVSFHIQPALLEPFEEFCSREGATLQMGLLAVVAVLLHRYSRQDDFTIGVPIWGRNHPDLEHLIGFFINTLPIRTCFSAELSFRQLLSQVKGTSIAAYDHQELPFEQIVETLNPPRDTSRNPLVQVMLQLMELPPTTLRDLDRLSVEPIPTRNESAKLDLSFYFWRSTEQGLHATITYALDLFSAARIQRLACHLLTLLASALQAPDSPISSLTILPEAERQLIESWQEGPRNNVPDHCVHQLFERQVERTPGALALIFEDQQLTYSELNWHANQLAHHLIDLGVGPDVIVAVCLERSIELIVSLLAILKAGGAYAALSPSDPPRRLERAITELGVQHMISQHKILARKSEPDQASLVIIDSSELTQGIQQLSNPKKGVLPSNLAYVIFTSGTTGTPKGVAMSHQALSTKCLIYADIWSLNSDSRVLAKSSVGFDSGSREWLLPLTCGASILVASEVENTRPDSLRRAISRHRCTHIVATPSSLGVLVENVNFHNLVITVGGEVFSTNLAESLLRTKPKRLIHSYGATETCLAFSMHDICSDDLERLSLPLGKPIPNTKAIILDPNGQPCPIGIPGELHIGGAGLARGYLNNPQLTAEKFIRDPFSTDPAARLYKSGDLASWNPDGTLAFHGRLDQQIKLRGFRIEPGEIEANLLAHPGVAQATVLLRQDDPANPRLIAYWVPHLPPGQQHHAASSDTDGSGTAPPTALQLRSFLSQRLPDSMVPAAFIALEALPLTSNGKLDRRALPEPSFSGDSEERIAPSTELEHQLHGLWSDVLGHSDFGITDNFFIVGGHSLAAARLVSRIEQAFGTAPPLATLFQSPTITGLVPLLVPEQSPSDAAAARHPIPAAETLAGDWPPGCQAHLASHAQTRLWFLHQLEPQLSAYHLPFLWRLHGDLDIAALRQALTALIERHPTLRTSFQMLGDEVLQLLHPATPFPLSAEPLEGRDPDALIDTWLDQEATTPFDLSSGLLLRVRLLRIAEHDHLLLLNHHHIASDGWSVSVLWRDLTALYNAYRHGHSPDLRPLTVHYQDYAAWQRQRLSGSRLRELQDHWIEVLTGLQPLDLPADRPRPAVPSYRGGSVRFTITAGQLEPFEALCHAEGATLQMGLLALLAVLLHQYSQQDDFAIGVPIWGRNHPDLEPLIGFFVNTLPIRTRFSAELSFRQLLAQVKATSIAAYNHQELPFEQMVQMLQPERDRSRNPLVQVMLQLIELRDSERHQLDGLDVELLDSSARSARLDLEIFLRRQHSGDLQATISYANDLFDHDRIERLSTQLLTLLASATATPDAPAVALNLLPDAELALLESWQQGPRLDLQDLCVHQLFERHVVQTPEAIALIFRDQRLTYAELNTRANQLAQHLIAQGVGPEVIVAVCLERSVELIVALLAILKAGGAYLPLDPAWPHERIQQLLHDGGQPWLLIDAGERSLPRWDRCITLPLHQTRGASASRSVALSPVPEFLPGAQLDCAAYLLFTSGSTGKPKGVLVDHLALTSRCQTLASELDLRPGRRVLGLTTAVFDIAIVELLVSLASGATIVLLPEAQRKDTAAIAALVHADGIDVLQATPSVLEALLTAGFKPRADMLLLAGGEPLAPALAQALTASGARLINGYGPTEATIYTTLAAILPGQTVSIGRPIAATLVRVLDRNGQSCPIGMPGELHIGGTGLARGYLNNPQLTAETFIADPGSTDPTSRLYKSGDLASWNPDGTLAFHGRLDQQIKLRGFRIEPGEIEANLLAHPGVAQAAVLLRHDDPANPRLIAYWVPQLPLGQQHHAASSDTVGSGTAPPTALQLRSFLSHRLPDSMVPAAFIALEALPLTPNGKLDRRALPEPSFSGDSEERIAPSTELEHQLHGLWSEVLGHSDFGITDNFFLVGGHSLSSARLTALIEQRLGRRLPLSVLFQQPTLRELSQWLASADPSTADQPDALPFGTAAHAITTRDGRSGFRSLVTLQHQGEAPALFVVHGGNGDVYIHLHLARCLAPHRPVHGLQAVGFDGSAPRHRSVAEMAAHYADEILRCQPSGPHHLLGYSGGGWYAWAVAAELHRRGARPGLIGLVDTGATADLHRRLRLRQLVLRQLRRLPRRARSLGNTDISRWPAALNRKLQALQFIAWTLLRPRGAIAPEALNPTAVPKPTQPLRGDYFIQLHTYYRPPRLPLRTDVFAANSRMKEHQQLWNFYAQGQAVLHSCLQEHGDYYNADLMPEFAHLLESVLEQIEAG